LNVIAGTSTLSDSTVSNYGAYTINVGTGGSVVTGGVVISGDIVVH
jgi:hypothetical protein